MLTVEEVLTAYIGAWNERDEDARLALLEQCWSDDGVLCDPIMPDLVAGRTLVSEAIGKACAEHVPPGYRFVRLSEIQQHHHVLRYVWGLMDENGREVRRGEDVISRSTDGRISHLIMFFGSPEELGAPL